MTESGMPPVASGTYAGGVFLSSHDPGRLVDWFRTALGLDMQGDEKGGMIMLPCGEGYTVLGVQPARPGAPAPPDEPTEREPYGRQTMMCNLRVDDLDTVLERLRDAGTATVGPEIYEGMGRFAWTRTPDGHDIELWQP